MIQRAHALLAALALFCTVGADRPPVAPQATPTAAMAAQLANLPLRFEANAGQWDARVRFVAHGNGTTLSITDDGMTASLRDVKMPPPRADATRDEEHQERVRALAEAKTASVTMKLVGVHPSMPLGEDELGTKSNFFLGNDPAKWRTNVPNFAVVRAKDWLPGVDVVWHGGPHGFEYDLDVRAGTDARAIAFEIEGADALHIAEDGSLEIATAAGTLTQRPARVMQGGKELHARYLIDGTRRVRFELEGYDRARALWIDPTVVYATYLGGSDADRGAAVALDSAGNLYVTGTARVSFPTSGGALHPTFGAAFEDAFVTKFNAAGSAIIYSTYVGASSGASASGIAVDSSGNAYITGRSNAGFPTTGGAFQTTFGGGLDDAFVTKLDAPGSALIYSTYLGGGSNDWGMGIALDSSGNAYVTGGSGGSFPTTGGAYQTTYNNNNFWNVFVTKLDASGAALVYSTYLHGSTNDFGYGIAVDSSGDAYVTGETSGGFPTTAGAFLTTFGGNTDGFVTKLDASGSALVYSTYLGGSAHGIALDSLGSAFITGETSGSFPTTGGAYQTTFGGGSDAFVTKLDPSGSAQVYSTYVGGSDTDIGNGIALDSAGNAWLTGYTYGSFPTTTGAYQTTCGGSTNAFLARVSATGAALDYSTYLGGTGYARGNGVAVASDDDAYVVGYAENFFPTTAGAYQTSYGGGTDAFIAKFTPLTLSPPWAAAPAGGSVAFSASGGAPSYLFSLQTNASGGSVAASTGVYTAGPTAGGVDVVQVTDSVGRVATAKVWIPEVRVSVSNASTTPRGTLSFSASGGSGSGYAWSISTNNSGGSIIASTGAYIAGATGSVNDTVRVQDSLGNTATVVVNVGPGITITPASPTAPPKGTITLSAKGGSWGGYTWAITTNNSGGSIGGSTGQYTAGATTNCIDTVAVTDSLGNTASVYITVGAGVSITPSSPKAPPKGALAFTASGGSGTGYSWSITTNKSAGWINPSSGGYTAGPIANVVDTVNVADSVGNTASVNVSVGGGLAINPATPTSLPKGSVAFTATGGSGKGFLWSLQANDSGGSIQTSTGVYTAGATGSVTDVVKVIDSVSNSATVSVAVTAGVDIAPATVTVAPGGNVTFSATGGSGAGYSWLLWMNGSGGTVAGDGTYTAGPTGNVTDRVRVADSLGNIATAMVTVTAGTNGDGGVADGGGAGDAEEDGGGAGAAAWVEGGGCAVGGEGSSRQGVILIVAGAVVSLVGRRRRRA